MEQSITLSESELKKIKEIETEVGTTLLRFREQRVSSTLAVFALARCMRALLKAYQAEQKLAIAEAVRAFISGDKVRGDVEQAGLIDIPDRLM